MSILIGLTLVIGSFFFYMVAYRLNNKAEYKDGFCRYGRVLTEEELIEIGELEEKNEF